MALCGTVSGATPKLDRVAVLKVARGGGAAIGQELSRCNVNNAMDPALVEAICRYCPVFWFHPDEKYFPSSWNHLLQIGTLKVDGKVSTSLGSASDNH